MLAVGGLRTYPPHGVVGRRRVRGINRQFILHPAVMGVGKVIPMDEHRLVPLHHRAGKLFVKRITWWVDYVGGIVFNV